MEKGKLIVICAPSGSGKSTLIKKLKKRFPHIHESVSFTTRPSRPGESHGQSYFFIDKAEFEKKIKNNDFLEHAKVHGNYYGTSKEFVSQKLNEGTHLLFDLDIQGADSFKNYFKSEAKVIFITPPSIEELESRLRGRGTESEEAITTRIKNAKSEIKRKHDYDFLVVNNDLDLCYNELENLFLKILEG